MLITLIRHSKTIIEAETHALNWVLSDKGVEFAEALSQNDEIKNVNILYSSLQNKALETAVIIAKPHRIPIRTDDRLTEVTSITNKFVADPVEFERNVHDFQTGLIPRINGGETVKEALDRFNKAIEDIIKREEGKQNIGIVSHGNMLSLFSAQFINKTSYEIHKTIKMPAIAILDWDEKKFIKFFGELT
jgi:broad specificity phosphatase PhoE